jgi:hypothetical protein
VAASAGIGIVAGAGAATADSERVTQYWSRAEVASDGGAAVTEVIDYDFGIIAQDRHGIFRIIPGLSSATPITVDSPDAPDGVSLTDEDVGGVPGVRIRIGDPAQTVTGRHRYRIDYPLPGVVRDDVIDWEPVGTEWDVPIERAELHLLTPFELTDVACFEGPPGSTTPCEVREVEPGHVETVVEDLEEGEGVSIEGRAGTPLAAQPAVPEPPAHAPAEKGSGLLPPAGAAAAGGLLGGIASTVLVRRAGRERVAAGGAADAAYAPGMGPTHQPIDAASLSDALLNPYTPATATSITLPRVDAPPSEIRVDETELADMATTEFAPPTGLLPEQGGIVLAEEVLDQHKAAWLIQAAIDGAIDLDDRSGPIRLTRTGPGRPDQQPILDQAFDGASEITLGSYDRHFAAAWSQLDRQLQGWQKVSGLWDPAGDRHRVVAGLLGVLAVILGGIGTFAAGFLAGGSDARTLLVPAVITAALGVTGVAALVNNRELRIRTAAGSGLWLRTESFRRFLAGSEAYHAEEAAKRGVLREYTAWALALGEIDRWTRAVSASSLIPPETAGLHWVYLAPLLVASTSTTSVAPSSSGGGGGGFGGGGVGGGAGGGGGGSW